MKKLRKSWSKDYSSLKIFRDDIEEIAEIITSEFEHEDKYNKLKISADGFALENLTELKNFKGTHLRELELSVKIHSLSLTLTPNNALLRVNDSDDTTLMGIASRIDAVLQKRRRIICCFGLHIGPYLIGVLIASIFWLMPFINLWGPVLAILSLSIMLIAVFSLYVRTHVTTICLRYSHDESNFFVRNKDAILVNIVTAIFGCLLGIIGTLFIQSILAKSKDKTPPATSQTMPKDVNEVSQKQPEK